MSKEKHFFAYLALIFFCAFAVWIKLHSTTRTLPVINNPTPSVSSLSAATPTPAPQPIKLLFGGDMMFDRTIRTVMQQQGSDFILQPLQGIFSEYDVVIANLEGPVTSFPSRSVGSRPGSTNNFIFTFDPSILPMLKEYNMSIVNIGNNHITNFGNEGITQTKQYLQESEIAFFGNTGSELTPEERILTTTIGERTISFVNHNQFTLNGFEAALEDLAVATMSSELQIVMTHWGNEYQTEARGVIVDQAHQLVDAGADLVIGMHPHVVQQHEDYNGKRVYYSLGNLVFDQYFSKETTQGLLVGVEINPGNQMVFREIPVEMKTNGQTQLLAQ